jgi:hypothetical protein
MERASTLATALGGWGVAEKYCMMAVTCSTNSGLELAKNGQSTRQETVMASPACGTFLDQSLEELDGERKTACLLLEATQKEHSYDSMLFVAAYEDWWAVYRLWWDTWEAAWRSHQAYLRRPPRRTRHRARHGRSVRIAPVNPPGSPPTSLR